MTTFCSPYSVFFDIFLVHFSLPGQSFLKKKGATENLQFYQSAPLLAVATGGAALKAITTAKADVNVRLGKNSIKFCIIEERQNQNEPFWQQML